MSELASQLALLLLFWAFWAWRDLTKRKASGAFELLSPPASVQDTGPAEPQPEPVHVLSSEAERNPEAAAGGRERAPAHASPRGRARSLRARLRSDSRCPRAWAEAIVLQSTLAHRDDRAGASRASAG